MVKVRGIIGLCLGALLLSGCAVFGSEETDQRLEQELSTLMLDQQILETRLSLTEDRVSGLQTHLNEIQENLFAKEQKAASANDAGQNPKAEEKNSAKGQSGALSQASGAQAPAMQAGSQAPSSQALAAYKDALAVYNAGKYKQAEAMFKDFAKQYPKSSLTANAGYWLGECHYSQGRYDAAILAFQAVTRQYPKHNKAAASLLKTSYSYERLADQPNARFYLEQLLENYPKSEPAPLARAALSRM